MRNVFIALMVWTMTAAVAIAEDLRVISVTGVGSVEMTPDMATISLGVSHQAEEAGEALALTSQAVAAILSQLEAAGIDARDMQTDTLSLQPVWARNNNNNTPPRVVGFNARNSLTVRVRDLSGLGGILDAVVRDGANTFNGLRFSVQNPEDAQAKARAAAVADGMARATQLAEAAGVTLGPVQSISEHGGFVRPEMMEMASARMAADVPVAAGEVSMQAQVSMVFVIADN